MEASGRQVLLLEVSLRYNPLPRHLHPLLERLQVAPLLLLLPLLE
jgi:hypothetical protein